MNRYFLSFLLCFLVAVLRIDLAWSASCVYNNNCPSDNSCIASDDIVKNNAAYALPEYQQIASYFTMTSTNAEGQVPATGATNYTLDGYPQVVYDPTGAIMPLCDASSSQISFCYNYPNATYPCHSLNQTDTSVHYWDGTFFQALSFGNKLCVQTLGSLGWVTLGCKNNYPTNAQFMQSFDTCVVSQSCWNTICQRTQSLFPLSGVVVQCVNESVQKVLLNQQMCCDPQGNCTVQVLPQMQNALRKAVMVALTLYVMLFGIRTAFEPPSKGEVLIFILKMLLVLYFSVGFYVGPSGSSTVATNAPVSLANPTGACLGSPNSTVQSYQVNSDYQDGLTSFLLPAAFAVANSLSNIVFQSGGNAGLCQYNPSSYAAGYQYLALWDALDCRVAYYLGFVNPIVGTIQSNGAGLLNFILLSLLGVQIIFLIFSIVFAVMLISFCIYFINIYILALIAITFMVYLAPLFVPMALFRYTRPFFDGWYRMLLSFALQPMVIAGFLSIMLTIFDQAFYTDCQWVPGTISMLGKNITIFTITNNPSETCQASFGYQLASAMSNNGSGNVISVLFFNIPILSSSVVTNLLAGLITVTIFCFLFYFFAQTVGDIAADLTGGPSLGAMAIKPNAVTDKFAGAVGNAIDAYIAKRFGKGAANAAQVTRKNIGKGIEAAASKKNNPTKNRGVAAATTDDGDATGIGGSKNAIKGGKGVRGIPRES